MRRILRRVMQGERDPRALGDLSTLSDSRSVETLLARYELQGFAHVLARPPKLVNCQ